MFASVEVQACRTPLYYDTNGCYPYYTDTTVAYGIPAPIQSEPFGGGQPFRRQKQLLSRSTNRSISSWAFQPISSSTNQSAPSPINQSITVIINPSTDFITYQSINQSINQSIDQPILSSTNQRCHLSINQSTNDIINQSAPSQKSTN